MTSNDIGAERRGRRAKPCCVRVREALIGEAVMVSVDMGADIPSGVVRQLLAVNAIVCS